MVTPGQTVTPAPSHTFAPMVTRLAAFKPHKPYLRIGRMRRGNDLHIRPQQHIIPEAHIAHVEYIHTVIDEHVFPEVGMAAIVEANGLLYP